MEVKKIEKKNRVDKYNLIQFQLLYELVFLKKEKLIPSDIDILTLLGLHGEIELSKFCAIVVKNLYPEALHEQFSVKSQNIRNRIEKLYKRAIISKTKGKRKTIKIADSIVFYKEGNVLLNYNLLGLEE